jgi:hypothetical protein
LVSAGQAMTRILRKDHRDAALEKKVTDGIA